jgi:hypothetical protein
MVPNVESPSPSGEHQAKEIDETSGIPQSLEAVLRHKRFAVFGLKTSPQKHTPLSS